MTGIYGTTQEKKKDNILISGLKNLGTEEHLEKKVSNINIGLLKHSGSPSSVTQDGSLICWLWGEIKGYQSKKGEYRPREKHEESSNILLKFYQDNELQDLERINGEFFAAVFDQSENNLNLITDRLSSRPVFYTVTDDNISFSNDIQSLREYLGQKELEEEYCIEYLTYKRVFGVETPFKEIKQLQPSSTLTFDLDTGEINQESYWQPKYAPEDKPYSYFVNRFIEIFQDIMEEQIKDSKPYGLMLSGGSDSRLIAGSISKEITCFHANEWMNSEAKIAKEVAKKSNHKYEFLKRDKDYQVKALKENIPLFNFASTFNQAQFYGFKEKLSEKRLLTGMFADTLFKGHFIDAKTLPLFGGKEIVLPLGKTTSSINEYLEKWDDEPPFINYEKTPKDIMSENINSNGNSIRHHGVTYPNIRALSMADEYYPLTNQPDFLDYEHLTQIQHTTAPFLDSRLIDLHLKVPRQYLIRKNIINSAIKKISPELGDVELSSTKLPAKYPELAHFSYKLFNSGIELLKKSENREPHHSNGSWTDHDNLLRSHPYFSKKLESYENILEEISYIKSKEIYRLWNKQKEGQNFSREFYRILTFMETPAIKNNYTD